MMDQVKLVLAVMKKNAFWILTGVVVLVGLGVWFTAARALAERYAARKTELETKYTTVSGIKSEATGEDAEHPSEEKNQRWLGRVTKNRGEVLKAWEMMYDVQKQRNEWPSSLSPRFHEMIGKIGDADIPNNFLIEYQNFIKGHFPFIDQIIDRRKPKKVEGVRGMTPGMPYGGDPGYAGAEGGDAADAGTGDPGYVGADGSSPGMIMSGMEMEGIVDWVESDYGRVQQGVYWVTRPLTIEVRLAQEDLWVYEALLRSIAKTNKDVGATSYYNAAIKKIWALEIGQPAAAAMKSAKSRLGGMGGGGGGMGGDGMQGADIVADYGAEAGPEGGEADAGAMMGSYGEGMGSKSRDPEMVRKRLLTGRYVDLTGEPQAADSTPFAEFKLMPVHIAIIMDQQKLPDFLVNLANCEMPVDVKQVSIQASGKTSFTSGGSGGYGGGGMMGGMGGYGGMGGEDAGGAEAGAADGGYAEGMGGGAGGFGGFGGGGAASAATDDAAQDVPIEIFGVIRIFNPPDMEKLGTGSATDESSEGPVAAAPPMDAPTMRAGGVAVPASGDGSASGPGSVPGAGPVPASGSAPGTGAAPGAGPGPATVPAPIPASGPAPAPGTG